MSKVLPVQAVNSLFNAFCRNQWIIAADGPVEDYEGLFERFCKMLALLSEEEQTLVIELTSTFQYFPFSKYSSLLSTALSKLPAGFFDQFKNIYLVPMKNSADVGVTKSDSSVMYPCKHNIKRKFGVERIEAYDRIDKLKSTVDSRQESLIIFTDDFIGTGDTAISAFDEYLDFYAAKDDEVIVISLVAQESGLAAIKNYGIAVHNAVTLNRGISDSAVITDKIQAFSTMDKIEGRLKIGKKFRRGYKESEALVSLIRTPNNTFPVFWYNKELGEKTYHAPFYR